MSPSPSPESPSSVPSEDTVKIINARWIPRGCTLYDDIGEIIRVGARLEAAAISEKPDGLDMPEVKKKRYRCLYGRILSTVDGLGDFIALASPSAIDALVRKITKAAQNARSEDTANLRNEFGLFASSDPQRTTLETPLTHSKDERGINHPDLARFLCPAQDLAKYDLDPMEGRKMMRDGRIKLEAGRFPIGFYKDHKYDPYNPEAGLFQSEELLKAARYIFTGKATTQDNYTPQGARGTTKINGIKRVTGYMIIYIACQVRFTASSFSTWVTVESAPKSSVAKGSSKSRIKPFSYAELHALGVSMLEREDGDEDETAREIKAVWNFHIFGDEDEEEHANDLPLLGEEADEVEEVSDWEKMEALRLARAEARQAKASSVAAAITPTSTNDVALPALVLGLTVSASALPNINAPPTLAGTAHRSLPHLVTMAPELLAQRGGSSTTPLTPLPLTSFEELRSDSPLTNTSPSLSPIPLPPHRETRAKASVNKRPYEDVAEDTNDAPKSKQAKNAPKTKTKTKAVATAKATKAAKAKEARAAKAAAAKVSTAAAKVKGTQ